MSISLTLSGHLRVLIQQVDGRVMAKKIDNHDASQKVGDILHDIVLMGWKFKTYEAMWSLESHLATRRA